MIPLDPDKTPGDLQEMATHGLKTEDKERQILKQRTRKLALETRAEETIESFAEVLVFTLANEQYALESIHIREVCSLREITALPSLPPFYLGVMNVRGKILSVIDLKRYFELPDQGFSDMNKVIIIHDDILQIGILADTVTGIQQIPLSAIQPSLLTLTGIRDEYLKGVTGDRLIILDSGRILSDEKIIVRAEI